MELTLRACRIDLDTGRILRPSAGPARLTDVELALVRYFALRPGRPVGRDELYREVWGYHPNVVSRALDQAIVRIRTKVERDPANPDHLKTVRGVGYALEIDAAPPIPETAPMPLSADRLVGRAATVDAVNAGLRRSRLVTLVGGPGLGKSRLAAEVGQRTPGARWLGERPWAPAGEAALWVVDGAEGLGAADRADLGQAMALAPVLATARAPLDVPGELVIEVEALGVADGVALLEARIAPQAADPALLQAVAERVEGIPLALELAASLIRLFGAAQTLDLLRPSLAPLDAGGGGLAAALDGWIHRMGDADLHALVALSPFRGGFTLGGATWVLGPEPLGAESVSTLARLRGRSVLRRGPGDRLAMFDVVRERVVAHAAPAEVLAARVRHAERFLGWVTGLGDDHPQPELAAERANLLAAADTLLEVGRAQDACTLLERVVDLRRRTAQPDELVAYTVRGVAAARAPEQRARFEAVQARQLTHAHRPSEALALARRAAERVAGAGVAARCAALASVIECAVVSGEDAEVSQVGEALLALAEGLSPDTRLSMRVLVARAWAPSRPHDALALVASLEGELATRPRGPVQAARWAQCLAWMSLDPNRAEVELDRLVGLEREAGAVRNVESLLLARAHVLVRLGRVDEAEAVLGGRTTNLGSPLDHLVAAWIAWVRGERDRCAEAVHEAVSAATSGGDRYGESLARGALAQLERAAGRIDTALALLDQAADLHPGHRAELRAWAAVVRAELGMPTGEVPAGTVGAQCLAVLAGERSGCTLGPSHELVDRIGADLTSARGGVSAPPRGPARP